MSKFTHSMCESCWRKMNPEVEPVRFRPDMTRTVMCCFCEEQHQSGIYVRRNPADMPCNGEHGIHKDGSL